MRAATGRQIFFDRVAEGLLTFFYPAAPRRLGLTSPREGPGVPDGDLLSLARALCRIHYPEADSISVIRMSTPDLSLAGTAAILDVEGNKSLAEAMAWLNETPNIPDTIIVIHYHCDEGYFPTILYDPRQQSDIIADALELLFSQCDARVSVLARARFDAFGFAALETSFNLFERPAKPNWDDLSALEVFYARLSRSWNYRGYPLVAEHIREWVAQFVEFGFADEAKQILVYLQQYGFVTETMIIEALLRLYNANVKNSTAIPIPISIQKPGKSEQKLAYRLRPTVFVTSIREALCLASTVYADKAVDLYCFDDCVGSGESLETYLFNPIQNPAAADLIAMFKSGRTTLKVLSFHADERGINFIQQHPDSFGRITIKPARRLDKGHRAFSDESKIVADPSRRGQFRQFCLEIGEKLNPGNPSGWEDGQWCIVYDYTVPDNSLPILYGIGDADRPWKPLFERAR
jgi:hypothetical protein